MPKMNKWTPTTDLMMLRRMGKLTEELGELQAVAARCIIQGIDEVDPSSGKVNRQRLEDEIADVMAQCRVTVMALGLDGAAIGQRDLNKQALMAEWEALFVEPAPAEHEFVAQCEHCADRDDGFYGSWAPPCPLHDAAPAKI